MKSNIDVWQELYQSIAQGLLAGDTDDKFTLTDILEVARQGANDALEIYLAKKDELV
ncbi:hypothetical protein HXW87_20775 [Pseudomonas sp. Y5-11]|jgi:hypothetical protein|uniref:hypothetical protein n=1 Tax=Pseudomonas sp. Y5-11 TaxID=2749808 RepID=UPI001EFBF249|nr:hypothetical protein [Pseudomonas sp. Y5-11]ULN84514.1 hypothetical protein HXW87_20775 [Pseudomonas sp. Y5-11]